MRSAFVFAFLGLALLVAPALATPTPIDPPVRIGILGDRTGDHQPGIYEGIVAELGRLRPDLVLNVGDMIEGYSTDSLTLAAMWDEYDAIVAPLGALLHRTPGNHDITYDAAEPTYRSRVGPPNTSFDFRGIHVVTFDSSRWDTYAQMPPAQLAWITDDLERNADAACTIVCTHKPLWFRGVAAGAPDPLHALFVRTGVDAVFTGHYHQYLSGAYDGIRYTSVGSSGGATDPGVLGPQYHFTWVTVDREGVQIAPIDAGSVRSWSDVPAAEYHVLEERLTNGLRFPEPWRVPADLATSEAPISLIVDNTGGPAAIDDTLRWTLPPDWTIEPATAPVRLDPGAALTLRFRVACRGKLYPVPTAQLTLPYAPGKSYVVPKTLAVARTAEASRGTPVIDARVDEACWRDPVEEFFAPDGGRAGVDATRIYFAHDDQNLYIAAVCQDSRMDSLRTDTSERDGTVYGDDCVGFFLEPQPRSGIAYQIYVNPRGTVFDQKLERQGSGFYGGDRTWNGEYEVRTERSPTAWTVELRIPIAQFATRIDPNTEWRINFRRKQPRRGTAGDWQVPIDYDPASYGYLRLK